MQKEINFVLKLIRMRRASERLNSNLKAGVMENVDWLDRHIKANGYLNPSESKSFFIRHIERIKCIMFWDKSKLVAEFNELNAVSV